jgi:hypothetical protein
MSDGKRAAAGLRERFADGAEDKLGKALADLIENPLVSGTIGRAFDARDRAAQAQELAFNALNLPTAADIERLTRRLRSVSQRLEGIEDGVHRLNRALSDGAIETRLSAVEDQLKTLSGKLAAKGSASEARTSAGPEASASKTAESKTAESKTAARKPTAGKSTAGKPAPSKATASKATRATPKRSAAARPARASKAKKSA